MQRSLFLLVLIPLLWSCDSNVPVAPPAPLTERAIALPPTPDAPTFNFEARWRNVAIPDAANALGELSKLEVLFIESPHSLPNAAIAELRKKLPNCKITISGPARRDGVEK